MTTPPEQPVPFRAGAEPGAPRPEAAVAAASFAGPAVLLADVSEFQPNITNAAYLAWSKAIVIRCAYGSQHDDKAWYGGQRRDLMHAGGIRFLGIYQYLTAGENGGVQAQAFHRIVGNIRPGEVFIADYEEGQRGRLTEWYDAMRTAYGASISPYLWTYSGLNFGQANGVLPVEWIAAYQSAEPSTAHRLWQFTDAYKVPGVGTCDCSVFHGSIDALAAMGYTAPTTATGLTQTVPNVIGMTAQDAADAIRRAGLHPHGLPIPKVISQLPKGGTKAAPGSTVSITV